MANRSAEFPATLEIDYPDRELNRLTTFFQPFTVIPIAIILALITRATLRAGSANYLVGSGGIVFPATRAHAAVPPEVPTVVVRLEPGADAVQYPRVSVSRAARRRISIHGRGRKRAYRDSVPLRHP